MQIVPGYGQHRRPKLPIGCVISTGSTKEVTLYPTTDDDTEVFWDGSPYRPICKAPPCGSTRGYADSKVIALSRTSELSYCQKSAVALKKEEDEQYLIFFATSAALALCIEIGGGIYLMQTKTISRKHVLLVRPGPTVPLIFRGFLTHLFCYMA